MAFKFNYHKNLAGMHAFLGASNYHWVKYDDEKLLERYSTFEAAKRGTELHDFAARCIELGIKLADNKSTLSLYVNDAIRFGMKPEQVLYYSENCFGTADSICFKKDILRIHDLKTGEGPTSLLQLRIYAALFCLEYRIDPEKIKFELRIYQSGEIVGEKTEPKDIRNLMDKIIHFDKLIMNKKREEEI